MEMLFTFFYRLRWYSLYFAKPFLAFVESVFLSVYTWLFVQIIEYF